MCEPRLDPLPSWSLYFPTCKARCLASISYIGRSVCSIPHILHFMLWDPGEPTEGHFRTLGLYNIVSMFPPGMGATDSLTLSKLLCIHPSCQLNFSLPSPPPLPSPLHPHAPWAQPAPNISQVNIWQAGTPMIHAPFFMASPAGQSMRETFLASRCAQD